MTTSEIKYTINTLLGEPLDMITPLKSVAYIKISSHECKFPDIKNMRFKFNTKNELLECYLCKPYSGKIEDSWVEGKNYDYFDNKIFKYMFDPVTLEPFVDVYDFNSITCIAPRLGGDK